jgi:hypothetical protein
MKIKTPATSISKDNVVIGKEIAGKDDKSTVLPPNNERRWHVK